MINNQIYQENENDLLPLAAYQISFVRLSAWYCARPPYQIENVLNQIAIVDEIKEEKNDEIN